MVYKPFAVRVALIAGLRRGLPVIRYMTAVAEAVAMWESPQGFQHPGNSTACFLQICGIQFAKARQTYRTCLATTFAFRIRFTITGWEEPCLNFSVGHTVKSAKRAWVSLSG